MLRHSRRRVLVVTLLLIFGLGSGVTIARQPFTAAIQTALRTLGLWPYGVYANGEIPVWSAASNRFMPGSGGGGLQTDVNIAEVGGVAIGSAVPVTGTITAVTSITNPVAVTGTFFQATQPVSGTVTANAGTNLNTSALLTTAAHDAAFGTAGSADAQVRTVQGIASMTPLLVGDGTGAFNVIVDSGTITTVSTLTAITNNVNVIGTLAADGAASGTNRVATLPFIAETGALPTLTDARNAAGYVDTNGKLYTRQLDPCSGVAKRSCVVNTTSAASFEIANAVASEFWYICSVNVVVGAAQGLLIASDDTDGCGSITAGLNGGTTAATGFQFGANGGEAAIGGNAAVMKSATANHYLCLVTSTTAQTSGTIAYVSAP